LRDIGAQGSRPASLRLNGVGGFAAASGIARSQEDVGSGFRQAERDMAPDAAAAPGHQGRALIE